MTWAVSEVGRWLGGNGGQKNGEAGAFAGQAGNFDPPRCCLMMPWTVARPKRCLADFLGGEERLKDAGQVVPGAFPARIGDGEATYSPVRA